MAVDGATRFVAAGDWFALGRIPEAVRVRPDTAAVIETLRAADIAFANLEAPLTTRGVRAEKQNTLRADPGQVEDLLAAGLDVVSLANNHMLDYGIDGLTDTLALLERQGVRQVGGGGCLEAARQGVVLDGPGGRMGFLAFASTLPQGFAAAAGRPGIAPIHVTAAFVVENPLAQEQPGTPPPVITFPLRQDLDAASGVVRGLTAQADFVAVSAHWGVAGQDAIMDYQREVGRALIDAGCDMILGHHPHRLHGVELYRGKPIFYSLGNFVFEPLPASGNSPHLSFRGRMTAANVYGAMRREGVLVDARVRGGHLEGLSLLPVLLDEGGYPTLRTDAAAQFASLLADLSAGMGTRFEVETGRILIFPA
ncbi:MAG TPA: CapA family protein [Candidatus Methylomirabilis sp.]|nr:CapA family protein [Candidatus Methylomirabilis sp.]